MASEPRVGIFWLIEGKPLIDSTSLSEAEPYGDFLTYPLGHDKVWEQRQGAGVVPADTEYEEFPRGRVTYNSKTQQFTFFADRCIFKDKAVVGRIMSDMNLPGNTRIETDSHYRCPACLMRNLSE